MSLERHFLVGCWKEEPEDWNFVRADGIPRVLSGLATEPSETGEGFQSAREGEGEVHVCSVGW